MTELNIGVIIFPSAEGVDNVEYIFMSFYDSDLMFELRLLTEVEIIYKLYILLTFDTNNMGVT